MKSSYSTPKITDLEQFYENLISNFDEERKTISRHIRFLTLNQEDLHHLSWQEK